MPNANATEPPRLERSLTISWIRANVEGTIFASVVLVAMIVGYELLWSPAEHPMDLLLEAHWVVLLAGFAGSVAAHELLHGVGFRTFAQVPWRVMRFGVRWRVLVAYAHTPIPMPARSYRWSAALPGLVLGLAPATAGMLAGMPGLAMYGAVMLAAAGGDAAVLRAMRHLPGEALVQDDFRGCGCVEVRPG